MSSSMNLEKYAPVKAPDLPVVQPGEFVFAASHFDHGHIYEQIDGLTQAGATLKYLYEPDAARHKDLLKKHPSCRVVDRFEQILDDPEVRLVASAAIPCERCAVGLRVMDAGKDYFTDKAPFTSLEQLEQACRKVRETGRKYMVFYGERLHNEAAWHAGELIRQGALGKIVQVLILAPHRLGAYSRPAWFFQKQKYGGILTDIGSHQFEQFLHYPGASDGTVNFARVANTAHSEHPELEDFGEASLTMDTGASCYCRLDWMNPQGLRTWGDGRTFILGTGGTMEIRKYLDVARDAEGGRIFLVDQNGEHEIPCQGRVGFPFFGRLILDGLNRTENAMTQEHAFKAAELSLQAQVFADARRRD